MSRSLRCSVLDIGDMMLKQLEQKKLGFTLIELMVVVAIIAILAALSGPGFQQFIAQSRFDRATQDLRSALRFARSEALNASQAVWVCGAIDVDVAVNCDETSNDWSTGWLVVIKDNNTDTVAKRYRLNTEIDVQSSRAQIEFDGQGLLIGGQQQIILNDTDYDFNQRVVIHRSGMNEIQ